ncbi:PREDICTED: uncharacterized protein At3g28850-like [Ipomoea nil]|uniref:uncharacterized protein At3g28850-like n=1 Tax=Ipomoea nil TaxID=35883 RepID=UPI0009009DD9|nr:PREDICTED: uncharacterized protein At3g28850-like [Ipomoea nil]
MGCATSKPRVCRHCKAPCSPVHRSYSMQGEAAYHTVALTSSTLGSLKLDPLNQSQNQNQIHCINDDKDGFGMGLIEAKTWSEMINEKIPKLVPKTPIRTPPGEPETINAWELMEGLEDVSPLKPPHHLRSFSFQVPRNPGLFPDDQPTPRVKDDGDASVKPPPWAAETGDDESNSTSNDTSIVPEFDPEMISAFRKALENPFVREEEEYKKNLGKNKVVLYFTSLRGVRKTYEDCCHVRAILKAIGVKIDERDVSMHSGFKEELKELLGDTYGGACLPRVFVGKNFLGGADEIRRMHEDGQLEKAVEGCEMADGSGCAAAGNGGVCESCGDIRFVPCETCSGSCKIYCEADYEDDEYEDDDNKDDDYGFQRCPDCNENGLIRCPICCD